MNQVDVNEQNWKRLYTEKLFPKIKEYKREGKQSELAIKIREIKKSVGQEFKADLILDESKKSIVEDIKYHHQEIDPFTVLSLLNVGSYANRLQMHNAFFEPNEEVKFQIDDIKNIPSSDGQRAWYYPYKTSKRKDGTVEYRKPDTISKLWALFEKVTDENHKEYLEWKDVEEILEISSVGINKLSTALYRCKPDLYFPLNAVGQRFLTKSNIKFNVKSGNNSTINQRIWTAYIKTLNELKNNKNILNSYLDIVEQDNQNDSLFTRNQILYGPAGTGKTYHTINHALAIINKMTLNELDQYLRDTSSGGSKNLDVSHSQKRKQLQEWFNENLYQYSKNDENEDAKNAQIRFVTFHQSYGYEEFVEGIRVETIKENPEDKSSKNILNYDVKPGIFKQICESARENPQENYVLIIDEINRGNISKIFGELITLIEESKREGKDEALSVTLPYSGESFSVPSNLYIIGTMNSSDRSLTSLDLALRRRFEFIEMLPDPTVLEEIKIAGISVATLLEIINKRIKALLDQDHCIGHANFTHLTSNSTVQDLMAVFEKKIIPLLQEYFFDDWEKINLVLGGNRMIIKDEIKKELFLGMMDENQIERLNSRSWEINTNLFKNGTDKELKEALLKISGKLNHIEQNTEIQDADE